MIDELAAFKDWWLAQRAVAVPFDKPAMFDGQIWGAVLYRFAPWQVQLFILAPDSVVHEHRHPHVDSFEVYLAGDIAFSLEGQVLTPLEDSATPGFDGRHRLAGTHIRVAPGAWHGARTGAKGGVFLSIQRWLDGVQPTNVGDDWQSREGETQRNRAAERAT